MIFLGYEPVALTVSVALDTDFVAVLTADPAWGDGTGVALQFLSGGAVTFTWNATVTGGDASWNVPAVTVTELINSTSREARLLETAGAVSVVRAKGTVRIH